MPEKRIIDAAEERPRGIALFRISFALIVCALIAGMVVGAGCVLVLRGSHLLSDVVWDGIAAALPEPLHTFAPVILCTVGGIAIGFFTRSSGFSLDTLGVVVKRCRAEGGYRLKSWPRALVLFLLPIAFGGAVGPEAGISGFFVAAVTSGMRHLRRSGVAAVNDASHPFAAALTELLPGEGHTQGDQERHYKPVANVVLWAMAAIGFVLAIMGVAALLGPGSGLPRFDAIDYLHSDWLMGLVALVAGYLLAQLAALTAKLSRRLAERMGCPARTILCGVVLGLCAVVLPDVLFSGQTATISIIGDWQTRSVAALVGTCAVKVCLTQMCVEMDWVGGEFFPLIFCGVCAGYAVAAISGADAMLPVAVATGALVGGCTRKPVLTTLVLALCFPLKSIPVCLVAAFIAARAPQLVSAES